MAPSSATSSCTGRGPSRPHPMPRRSLLRQGTGGNAHALAPFPTAECADGATSKPAPAARAARRRGLPRTWPTSRRPWWARYPNWAAPRPRRQSKGGWGPGWAAQQGNAQSSGRLPAPRPRKAWPWCCGRGLLPHPSFYGTSFCLRQGSVRRPTPRCVEDA